MSPWRILIGPFAIVMAVTLAIWIPLSLLHASGNVGALGFAAIMIVIGIVGGRATADERWPDPPPRH
jgi:hypothetical protein